MQISPIIYDGFWHHPNDGWLAGISSINSFLLQSRFQQQKMANPMKIARFSTSKRWLFGIFRPFLPHQTKQPPSFSRLRDLELWWLQLCSCLPQSHIGFLFIGMEGNLKGIFTHTIHGTGIFAFGKGPWKPTFSWLIFYGRLVQVNIPQIWILYGVTW